MSWGRRVLAALAAYSHTHTKYVTLVFSATAVGQQSINFMDDSVWMWRANFYTQHCGHAILKKSTRFYFLILLFLSSASQNNAYKNYEKCETKTPLKRVFFGFMHPCFFPRDSFECADVGYQVIINRCELMVLLRKQLLGRLFPVAGSNDERVRRCHFVSVATSPSRC